jgi:hypothetical protein
MKRLLLVLLAFCTLSHAENKRKFNTPDELLAALTEASRPEVADISWTKNHVTKIGVQVWDWLVHQRFFEGKPKPKILERKDETMTGEKGRYELVLQYRYDDGYEKVAIVFFSENGEWKLHDVFLFDMKGDRFDMFLSYCIREPKKTGILFAAQNPGKAVGSLLKAIKSGADWLGAIVGQGRR